jgi:histidine ammonia-lyase
VVLTGADLNSGLMITQDTAAALPSENTVLAHPSSADFVPTSANREVHVSPGATAARHARIVLGHVEQILAIELLCAAQALDLRLGAMGGAKAAPVPGAGVAATNAEIRRRIAHLGVDREPGPDLAAALELVRSGTLAALVS